MTAYDFATKADFKRGYKAGFADHLAFINATDYGDTVPVGPGEEGTPYAKGYEAGYYASYAAL